MDEITIDDKTYISSKRAAAITGYAKDYVGQLCREGRVEARLIGRSWYVLEESIRKHRFEEQEETPASPVEDILEPESSEKTSNEAIWEEAVYTPEEVHMLPVVEEKPVTEDAAPELEPQEEVKQEPEEEAKEEPQQLEQVHITRIEEPEEQKAPAIEAEPQHAWESWFSSDAPRKAEEAVQPSVEEEAIYGEAPRSIPPQREHKAVAFDIGAVDSIDEQPYIRPIQDKKAPNRLIIKAIAIAVIMLFASLAVIGTGGADRINDSSSWAVINVLGGTSVIK